jgi:hypothetical protein
MTKPHSNQFVFRTGRSRAILSSGKNHTDAHCSRSARACSQAAQISRPSSRLSRSRLTPVQERAVLAYVLAAEHAQ